MTRQVAASQMMPSGDESGRIPECDGHDGLDDDVHREEEERDADAS